MTDLKKLRELAEDFERKLNSDCGIQEAIESGSVFHFAANPQAIIELLDRLERYEKALEKIPLTQFWAEAAVVAREALEGGK